ncbi:MAG: M43 family zinc metalloprotease [Thermoanaerobaculia bacterium]
MKPTSATDAERCRSGAERGSSAPWIGAALFLLFTSHSWTFAAELRLDSTNLVCATTEANLPAAASVVDINPSDCSATSSNPTPAYDPGSTFTIQVVVHVLEDTACAQGIISDELVASQIAILNEDYGALPGSPGAAGVDSGIRFALATVDPAGQPTTGITRSCNTTWFNDQTATSPYFDTLAWDPTRYLNLYTSSAGGARGYVPFLPAIEPAKIGTNQDRVVINWQAFGRPGPFPTHDGGRTATHEIGHFFGLFHVYYTGCGTATAPDCYSTGDTLCDTAPDEDTPVHHGCMTGSTSCGGVPLPVENYMELSDDSCMTGFTLEQTRRLRCTIASYRASLAVIVFNDGFENGGTGLWSLALS